MIKVVTRLLLEAEHLHLNQGLIPDLFFAAILIWALSTLVASRFLPLWGAALLALYRVSWPFLFFGFFDRGKWRFKDDLDYYYLSQALYDVGYTPLNTLFGTHTNESLSLFVGSEHTLYYWFNMLSFWSMGTHYFSTVISNVLYTFIAGYFVAKTALILNFSRTYATLLFIFFSLHWDVTAWSSFVNLKDCVVVMLTSAAFYFFFQLTLRFSFFYLSLLGGVLYLFTMLRHYVPPIFIVTCGLWIAIQWRHPRKFLLIPIVALGILLLEPWNTKYMDYVRLSVPFYPAIRFMLMPQFWTVLSPGEDFIEIPQFFHWIMFVPMVCGFFFLGRKNPRFRLMILYFGAIVLFYAMVPELQGVRQRFQLTGIIAWGQFHALFLLHHLVSSYKVRSHLPPLRPLYQSLSL